MEESLSVDFVERCHGGLRLFVAGGVEEGQAFVGGSGDAEELSAVSTDTAETKREASEMDGVEGGAESAATRATKERIFGGGSGRENGSIDHKGINDFGGATADAVGGTTITHSSQGK